MTPSCPACNPELTNDMREKSKYLNEPLQCFCMTSVPPLLPCFSECVTWIHPSPSSTWPNGGLLLGTWLSSWSCTNQNIEALSVGRNCLMCWSTHPQDHWSTSIRLFIFGGLYSTPTSSTVQDRVPWYPCTMVFLFSTQTEMPKLIIDNLGCGDNSSTWPTRTFSSYKLRWATPCSCRNETPSRNWHQIKSVIVRKPPKNSSNDKCHGMTMTLKGVLKW